MKLFNVCVSFFNGWIMQAKIRLLLCSKPEVLCHHLTIMWLPGCYQRTQGLLDRPRPDRPRVTTQWQDVHLRGVALSGPLSSRFNFNQTHHKQFVGECHTKTMKQNHYPRVNNKNKKISLMVFCWLFIWGWIPNTELAGYSYTAVYSVFVIWLPKYTGSYFVASYSPLDMELNSQYRSGWIFVYSCIFGFCY